LSGRSWVVLFVVTLNMLMSALNVSARVVDLNCMIRRRKDPESLDWRYRGLSDGERNASTPVSRHSMSNGRSTTGPGWRPAVHRATSRGRSAHSGWPSQHG
jgi:hypothetical protein